MPDPDNLMVLTAAGLVAGLWLMGLWLTRRRPAGQRADDTPVLPSPLTRPPAGACPVSLRRVIGALYAWLADPGMPADGWPAFDQLVREVLTEHVGATRVRCYHVRPGSELLQAISQGRSESVAAGPSIREGVFGPVVTTGREFVAGDPSHGPLVDDLAQQAGESWIWVWPIRDGNSTLGVVAVGDVRDRAFLADDVRQPVGQLISLCWQHMTRTEQLRIVRRTDQASGVLTRQDFFTIARHALADSYGAHEPVVVAVVALEGLRRLDDSGCWRQRDALIEQVGRMISRRVRTDDLVGRFADDRFVVLLRRLDSGLGRLIAEKLLASASELVGRQNDVGDQIRLRIGLTGSGLRQPSLEALLVEAFDAVERARKEGRTLESDLVPGVGGRPASET